MKVLKWITGMMMVLMALFVVLRFFEAAIYSTPILISIAIWYRGWKKSSVGLKYVGIFFPAAIAFFDVYFPLRENPFNFDAWIIYFATAFFPVLMLFASWLTRNRDFKKPIPILSYIVESIELANEMVKEANKVIGEEEE